MSPVPVDRTCDDVGRVTRLEPELVEKLSRLPEERQRALALEAARNAVQVTGLRDPRIEAALLALSREQPSEEAAAAVRATERELDAEAGAFRNEDGDLISGTWDEYVARFRQARAAAAVRFLFEADTTTAVCEAIYEAGAASDEYPGIPDPWP